MAGPAPAAGDLTAFARARLAEGDGQAAQAASGYSAALADAPGNVTVARRAYREALEAGDDALALRAIETLMPVGAAPFDAALFLYADAVHRGDAAAQAEALKRIDEGPFDFLLPSLRAWQAFERGTDPFAPLDNAGSNPIARRYSAETRALLLIATGKTSDGVLALQSLLGSDQTGRDLRISAAQLLGATGQGGAARMLLGGSDDPVLAALRRHPGKGVVASGTFGLSRLFTRLAADIESGTATPFSVTVARAALLAEPGNDRARLLLARALSRGGASERALAALSAISPASPYHAAAVDARIAVLRDSGDLREALAAAAVLARGKSATAEAQDRYGDLLIETGQYDAAANAFRQAIVRQGEPPDWRRHLQLGGALDEAGRWPEARAALARAHALAPDEPLVLNYLAYAQIEHGEMLAESEAMLERANRLKPGDVSILDSLAWAYFTRGDAPRALPLLERAAQGQPGNATISEHLGDAYWTLGRRYEARYAWRAAALGGEGTAVARLADKLLVGLPVAP